MDGMTDDWSLEDGITVTTDYRGSTISGTLLGPLGAEVRFTVPFTIPPEGLVVDGEVQTIVVHALRDAGLHEFLARTPSEPSPS